MHNCVAVGLSWDPSNSRNGLGLAQPWLVWGEFINSPKNCPPGGVHGLECPTSCMYPYAAAIDSKAPVEVFVVHRRTAHCSEQQVRRRANPVFPPHGSEHVKLRTLQSHWWGTCLAHPTTCISSYKTPIDTGHAPACSCVAGLLWDPS